MEGSIPKTPGLADSVLPGRWLRVVSFGKVDLTLPQKSNGPQ